MPNHLTEADVKWALTHLDRFGDTDLFPWPFELTVMVQEQKKVIDHIRGIDLHQHKWQEPRRALVLKDALAFRNASQLEPLDAVLFSALIRHDAKKLEARRGDEARNRIFSYRAHPAANGQLYVDDRYRDFWTESKRLAEANAFVLATDLTDFYNQVYHHTVEQEMNAAGVHPAAQAALKHLLQRSSVTVSRGIPIGPHGAHILAELSLRNIDELLVNRGVQYVRFVDDFHIFCSSQADAHRVLYELAHALDLAKLHLNRSKTRLLPASDWIAEADRALNNRPINDEEAELLKEMTAAFGDPYVLMGIHEIPASLANLLTEARLANILEAYLSSPTPDYVRVRWFLRRLSQTGSPCAVHFIAEHFGRFAPAATDAVRYLRIAIRRYVGDHPALGEKLLDALAFPIIAANPYLRLTVLSLFASVATLNHVSRLTTSFGTMTAEAQREVVLAATKAGASGWLRTHKGLDHRDPWLRRAILYSSSTWTEDERTHWSKTLKGSYGFLDDLIVETLKSEKTVQGLIKRTSRQRKRL